MEQVAQSRCWRASATLNRSARAPILRSMAEIAHLRMSCKQSGDQCTQSVLEHASRGIAEEASAQVIAIAMGAAATAPSAARRESKAAANTIATQAGVANLGLGLYNIYQMRRLGHAVKIIQNDGAGHEEGTEERGEWLDKHPLPSAGKDQDLADVHCEVKQIAKGMEQVRKDTALVRRDIQTVLSRQLYLIAWFSQGMATLYDRLGSLHLEMKSEFKRFMDSIPSFEARRHSRDLYVKLDMLAKKYDDMIEGVTRGEHFPRYLKDDAKEASRRADELYSWSNAHLSESSKLAVLQNYPYIITMAFAARVEMDSCIVRSEMMPCSRDRERFIDRSRKRVQGFLRVVARQVTRLVSSTTLLEAAFDLHVHVGTYITLIKAFGISLDMLSSLNIKYDDVYAWDDGLAPLRDVLHWALGIGDLGKAPDIELQSVGEMILWAEFSGADVFEVGKSDLKSSITSAELCYVLGAAEDREAQRFKLRAGTKAKVLQLRPAAVLRSGLWNKLQAVLNGLCPEEEAEEQRGAFESFALARTFAEVVQFRKAQATLKIRSHSAQGGDLFPAPSTSYAEEQQQQQQQPPPPPPPGIEPKLIGREECKMQVHSHSVDAVAVCAIGKRVISGSGNGTMRIWNLSSEQQEHRIATGQERVWCLALTSDGSRVVSGGRDASLKVWDTDSGELELSLAGHTNEVYAVAIAPEDDWIVSGGADATLKVWSASSGDELGTLCGHCGTVFGVAVTPDGETLVSGGADRTIRLWNRPSRQEILSLSGHSGVVRAVAVSSDGQRLASASHDKTIKVWSLRTGEEEITFTGHTSAATCVAFFPGGMKVASGGRDRKIKVWNVDTSQEEITLLGHNSGVNTLAIYPYGPRLVSGGSDRAIKVWI